MPTIKQRQAVKNIVENRGSISRAMIDANYRKATAKNPKNLTESKGYKEALKEYGLTEELITGALVDDIKEKPRKRYQELNLGAEILGMKKIQQESINDKPQVHLHFHKDKVLKIVNKSEEELQKAIEEEIKETND